MLKDKTVLIGITSSIAAYKMPRVVSLLLNQHCDVHVLMTENATNFINPITFETLTHNKCHIYTFDRNFQFHVAHISLAQKADLLLIAPASANTISKLAYGIADSMITTAALACTCPKIIAPAMNTFMYQNKIVQDNIEKLRSYNFTVIPPVTGRLACGSIGEGKMCPEETLFDFILKEIAYEKDLKELNILVTAGPTQEAIDPVRYLTNHSSGKMGYAIARNAMLRGANVTLISGKTNLAPPPFIEMISVISAEDMFQAVLQKMAEQDILIKSAAVADYRPVTMNKNKIRKSNSTMDITLERTPDILKHICDSRKNHQFVCGFSMDTQDVIERSRSKLLEKNLDMIVANSLTEAGSGFQFDTNKITIITKDKEVSLELMSKDLAANHLLTAIQNERIERTLSSI